MSKARIRELFDELGKVAYWLNTFRVAILNPGCELTSAGQFGTSVMLQPRERGVPKRLAKPVVLEPMEALERRLSWRIKFVEVHDRITEIMQSGIAEVIEPATVDGRATAWVVNLQSELGKARRLINRHLQIQETSEADGEEILQQIGAIEDRWRFLSEFLSTLADDYEEVIAWLRAWEQAMDTWAESRDNAEVDEWEAMEGSFPAEPPAEPKAVECLLARHPREMRWVVDGVAAVRRGLAANGSVAMPRVSFLLSVMVAVVTDLAAGRYVGRHPDLAGAPQEWPHRSPTEDHLPPSQKAILALVRKAGHRLTTDEIVAGLEKAHGAASVGTTKNSLATLVRFGVLNNRQDVLPKGYGLPEWGD